MADPVDLNFVTTDVLGGSVLQWADTFTSTKDLVDQAIAKLKPGQCIRRLVIAAHGAEKTDGFTVLDPETRGVEWIDGAQKQSLSPDVARELARLKAHFCKDAVIEFRVCRFGTGKKGEKAMQAVADAAGVAVTAPMGEISSLAAIGGLATDWRVAYPHSWGLPSSTSFWRGEPTRPPAGAPAAADIAPVTAQVVPLRNVTQPPPAPPPPVGKVVIANPNPKSVTPGAVVVGLGVLGGIVILGWALLNQPGGGTPIAANPSPTVTPTTEPTPAPTQPPTEPPTEPPTPQPTQPPTEPPTPTPTTQVAVLPPNGTYFGDGQFTSFDGSESYASAWRLTRTDDEVEIAQLLRPGGNAFQTALGIADPHGVMVAVNDDATFCEVLLVPADQGIPANFMYVAYGPPDMTCPTPADFVVVFGQFIDDPTGLEIGIPDHYGWGKGVTVGLVPIDNWTPR